MRRGGAVGLFGGLQSLLFPDPYARHRDESAAASAPREAFFQPKDLVWLDSCDKHRKRKPNRLPLT
ncbi:hypothetical protein CN934_06365 [Ensifer sp. MMN_5]|nr:hypothetical protein CN934_06365 [Ensifer sp. MMN_5]PND27073.1 hypothetical protein CN933_14035 [Sinorhizobium sp. M4_45]